MNATVATSTPTASPSAPADPDHQGHADHAAPVDEPTPTADAGAPEGGASHDVTGHGAADGASTHSPASPDPGHDMTGMEGHDGMSGMDGMSGHDGMSGMSGHGEHLTSTDVPSLWSMLTQWDAGWFYTLLMVAMAGVYLLGVIRLRRRGDAWSWLRTTSWLVGVLTLALVTGNGIGTWGMMLFSTHMVQHMVVGMLTPIFLVAAAPITLLLRSLPTQGAGAVVRRTILAVLHSRVVRVLCSPLITVSMFIISLYVLYFTPLLDLAMDTHTGHVLMLVHFVVVGIFFFGPIIAVDPWPRQSSAGARLVEMVIAAPFHAFFAIAIMSGDFPLSENFAAMSQMVGLDPMEDQRLGGGIAWAFGELPLVVVGGLVFAQWVRDETRAARRYDRKARRDGDEELQRYNEALARLNEVERQRA